MERAAEVRRVPRVVGLFAEQHEDLDLLNRVDMTFDQVANVLRKLSARHLPSASSVSTAAVPSPEASPRLAGHRWGSTPIPSPGRPQHRASGRNAGSRAPSGSMVRAMVAMSRSGDRSRAVPLFWRLFVPNAIVLVAACVVLILAPPNGRVPILVGGLVVLLVTDLVLMRGRSRRCNGVRCDASDRSAGAGTAAVDRWSGVGGDRADARVQRDARSARVRAPRQRPAGPRGAGVRAPPGRP